MFFLFPDSSKFDESKGKSFSWTATCEARTHDLKILRLLRCAMVAYIFVGSLTRFVCVPIISVIAQKFIFFS